jgi:hypothetical protein
LEDKNEKKICFLSFFGIAALKARTGIFWHCSLKGPDWERLALQPLKARTGIRTSTRLSRAHREKAFGLDQSLQGPWTQTDLCLAAPFLIHSQLVLYQFFQHAQLVLLLLAAAAQLRANTRGRKERAAGLLGLPEDCTTWGGEGNPAGVNARGQEEAEGPEEEQEENGMQRGKDDPARVNAGGQEEAHGVVGREEPHDAGGREEVEGSVGREIQGAAQASVIVGRNVGRRVRTTNAAGAVASFVETIPSAHARSIHSSETQRANSLWGLTIPNSSRVL